MTFGSGRFLRYSRVIHRADDGAVLSQEPLDAPHRIVHVVKEPIRLGLGSVQRKTVEEALLARGAHEVLRPVLGILQEDAAALTEAQGLDGNLNRAVAAVREGACKRQLRVFLVLKLPPFEVEIRVPGVVQDDTAFLPYTSRGRGIYPQNPHTRLSVIRAAEKRQSCSCAIHSCFQHTQIQRQCRIHTTER